MSTYRRNPFPLLVHDTGVVVYCGEATSSCFPENVLPSIHFQNYRTRSRFVFHDTKY